jgi:hypothetical protein
MFTEYWRSPDDGWHDEPDIGYSFDAGHHGVITVLNRMTGFGYRDVETGFRDSYAMNARGKMNYGKNFWLASGMFDIREGIKLYRDEMPWDVAVALIKENANNCVGEEE